MNRCDIWYMFFLFCRLRRWPSQLNNPRQVQLPDATFTNTSDTDNFSSGACHPNDLYKTFSCSYCSECFYSAEEKFKHESIHTGKVWRCEFCHKVFTRQSMMQRHIGAIHTKTRFACDKCPKTFSQKDNLQTHKRVCHL